MTALPFLLAAVLAAPAAETLPEGVTREEVVWMGTLPRRPLPNEDIVVTTPEGGPPRLSLRARTSRPEPLHPLPLGTNLLTQARAVSFGVDGRCAVSLASGQLVLECTPGASVAGAVLRFEGARLPQGGRLVLQTAASGSDNFRAELVPAGADARAPRPLDEPLPLPAIAGPAQLTVLAPWQGGKLVLNNLRIAPAAAFAPTSNASAWAWSPSLWRQDPQALIASARARGVNRLFVSLEVEDGKVANQRSLRRFLEAASDAGLAVEAVEGDPRMVLPAGRAAAVERARAIAAYQREASPAARLAGIQYDVEPYTLAEWGETGAATYAGWAETMLALAEATGEPIHLVLPFWIPNEEAGRAMLERIAPVVREVTVMSYRTDPALLSQIAEPLLAWGAANGKPVRLGLEAERLRDEKEQLFTTAAEGNLAVGAGEAPQVLLLDGSRAVPGAAMYRGQRTVDIPAQRLSFLGDEVRMAALARETAHLFAAWPNFAGFAFHGLEWPEK
ncbi:MAG TPA: hypothetical protein VGD10_13190 [Allosphingosinicella sp.]|uniref:hypothetical protein n=1 Tax=Allosphingosinicella sp. TaxID=2823234 RepID=UPI002ED95312